MINSALEKLEQSLLLLQGKNNFEQTKFLLASFHHYDDAVFYRLKI